MFFTSIIPPVVVFSKDFTDKSKPYSLISTTVVMPWASTSFSPGVTVLAPEGASLFSLAPLSIIGTKELPVEFKSLDKNKFWGGISVRHAPLIMNHAVIRDTKIGVKIRFSHSMVENVLFENVTDAVYVHSSSVKINHVNVFTVKNAPDMNVNVLKFSNSEITLENSIIRTPLTAVKIDTLDMGYCSNSKIINNIFYGSPQEDTDGIDIGDSSKNIEIRNNRIYDFADKGVSVGEKSQVTVTNNLIVNTGIGISAKDGASLTGSHNTFVNIATALSSSIEKEKVFGGTIHMTKSVFYQCPQVLYKSKESVLTVDHSLSNTESIQGEGNFLHEPVFINEDVGDYMLESPKDYGWERDKFTSTHK